ncbi:hypothetical protein [Saccharopolyspora shandongensis]
MDREQQASGAVSGDGVAINSVVPDAKSSRLVVTSGPSIVVDRAVTGHY